MPAILDIEYEFKKIKLVPDTHKPTTNNIFTIIVGKNGVGKSKILSEIAKTHSHIYTYAYQYKGAPQFSPSSDDAPKIIAASTSPFDKFPSTPRRSNYSDTNYRYIGMRSEGIYNTSSSVALLSSAAKGLLISAQKDENNAQLIEVFSALGFYPGLELIFKPSYIKMKPRDLYLDSTSREQPLLQEIITLEKAFDFTIEDKYIDQLREMPTEVSARILNAIYTISNISNKRKAIRVRLELEKDPKLQKTIYESTETLDALLTLLSSGFIRLMDIVVTKITYGEMSLKRASSGEQCLAVLMLGIAGHITNGSTILIDEPEISLHPKWQEIFMPLLIRAFSKFRDCQFIIATHSPQIISRLGENNCYILSLTRNTIHNSSEFQNRSADFQLAELFDAPGLMNEYIARLAFNLLAKVKSSKTLDADSASNLNKLIELSSNLENNDPTFELIQSVKLVCEHYANNK
ncbi:ATP-binding protein [Pseudomonas solani]|uniref:ATP-binding protein n=1 Tax=Pseudomonas solani TaxID=2731552 RepID=A0ABM7L5N4_9PSED|nr:ATP-binding protein [Pseudomonas solani]BCD84758.1 ATP-binding protein [Pseudomonas solani]